MLRFVSSRLLQAAVTVWIAGSLVFLATRLTGSPEHALLPADAQAGEGAAMADGGLCQAILDSAPLGFVVLEMDQGGDESSLRLVYANPAACELTGVDLRRSIGRPRTCSGDM